ncbi:MAG: YbaK/EbsC family protein [Candidatus Aenigmatarchaeota archaeon]
MINEEEKLKKFIQDYSIEAEHLRFEESLHSVNDVIRVTGFDLKYITKTMIFEGEKTVAAMVPAKFRVSVSKLTEATKIENLELANVDEAYRRTGYPVGGMPCFGYDAILVLDPRVLENEYVYTGGGSEFSLVKIGTKEILKVKSSIIKKIIGKKSN